MAIVKALEPLDFVHAIWEGGSAAFGRLDEMSDIDLYVDVDDEHIEEVLPVVEKALGALAPIDHAYHVPTPKDSGLIHSFYRLEGTSKHLLVDIAVIKHSSPDKFLEPEIHGEAIFHLDKDGSVKVPHLDREALESAIKKRVEALRARFILVESLLEKEIERGDNITAVDIYVRVLLGSLVEALRITHAPERHAFGNYHLGQDLPDETVRRLETLFFVKDNRDLRKKMGNASEWFYDVIWLLGPEGEEREGR